MATVYGPANGYYSAASIRAARESGGTQGNRILKVDPSGKAPSNARVGDYIETAGGTFQIIGGTPGNWVSAKQGTSGYGSIGVDGTTATGIGSGGGNVSGAASATPVGGTVSQLKSDLFALQERKRIEALEAAKKSGLDTLALERGKIDPMYNNLVAQTAGRTAQSGLGFAEYMAARGLTNSGASLQGQINLMGEQNRAVADINTQRAAALADIASRETAVQNAYDTGVVDAAIQKSIDQTNAMVAAQKRADEFAQTLQLRGIDQQNAIELANLKMANDLKTTLASIDAKYSGGGTGGDKDPKPPTPTPTYTPGNGAANKPGNTYTQMDVNNTIFPNRSPEGMRAAAQRLIAMGVPEILIENALRQAGLQ